MLKEIASRVFGAIAGGATGLISSIPLAIGYFVSKIDPGQANYGLLIAVILAAGWGVIWGAVSGLVRGIYTGATKGLVVGIKFPSALYKHYFGVEASNNELDDYIKQLDSKAKQATILSKDEIKKFKEYLETVQSEELKAKLKEEFANYQAYARQKCPLTGEKISKHGHPITIKVTETNQAEAVEKVYSRSRVLADMRYTGEIDEIGLETAHNNSAFKKEDIVSTGLPEWIYNFINDVRKRLATWLAAQKAEEQLQADLNGGNLNKPIDKEREDSDSEDEQEFKSDQNNRLTNTGNGYAGQYRQHGLINGNRPEENNEELEANQAEKPTISK